MAVLTGAGDVEAAGESKPNPDQAPPNTSFEPLPCPVKFNINREARIDCTA